MNDNIKLDWATFKNLIALAEDYKLHRNDITKLKQIKTLDEFTANKDAPYWLYWCAEKLKSGRIEAFEPIIATDSFYSYMYCRYIAKCRLPALEISIATNPTASRHYCLYIAKHKIQAMEEAIKKEPHYLHLYLNLPDEIQI